MLSWLKIGIGAIYMAFACSIHALILIALFWSRNLRIRSCNYWGWVTGRFILWLSGSTVTIHGQGNFDGSRPAIYASNHTSALDIFIGISRGPVGVVGVAKKEVIYYPFFGQLYWLSGHLRLDRGNHQSAMASMADLVRIVRDYRLSIWMWPEGTRSQDGRLLPFKKGLYHLAVQTGLPIVPVVVSGAHLAWQKNTSQLRGVPVRVDALPAIDTSGWKDRDPDAVLRELEAVFLAHLPADQHPAPEAASQP